MTPERERTFINLLALRDMHKTMLEHLRAKGKTLESKPDKTFKECAELTVKTNRARHDLYCAQYQINAFICGK